MSARAHAVLDARFDPARIGYAASMSSRPPARIRLLTVFAVGALATAACGSGSGSNPAQPRPGSSKFSTGRFGDLPQYPRADPTGPRTHEQGVTVRTYSVRDLTPKRLMQWYTDSLRADGWATVAAAHPEGKIWRGEWKQQRQHLLVSASAAPTITGDSARVGNTIQYSLSLGDPGVPVAGPDAGS